MARPSINVDMQAVFMKPAADRVLQTVTKTSRQYKKPVLSCPVSGFVLSPVIEAFLQGAARLALRPLAARLRATARRYRPSAL
jgi:hypothetical protein